MKIRNFLLGMAVQLLGGVCLIYAVNEILSFWSISTGVGINPVTMAVSCILGIPGIVALYGLSIILSF